MTWIATSNLRHVRTKCYRRTWFGNLKLYYQQVHPEQQFFNVDTHEREWRLIPLVERREIDTPNGKVREMTNEGT